MEKKDETEMLIYMLNHHEAPKKDNDGNLYTLWGRVCAYVDMCGEELRMRQEKKMEDKNDWYKRGEFPPVGTVCEVLYYGAWERTKIIGWDDNLIVLTTEWDESHKYNALNTGPLAFRPLQTERERLINEAQKLFIELDSGISMNDVAAINVLYKAGMLKMPEDG